MPLVPPEELNMSIRMPRKDDIEQYRANACLYKYIAIADHMVYGDPSLFASGPSFTFSEGQTRVIYLCVFSLKELFLGSTVP